MATNPRLPPHRLPVCRLDPYLERIDHTIATAPRSAEVIQSLSPNVLELLGRSAGENLVPLLRNVGQNVKGRDLADQHFEDMMDRTLKNFDQLKDLAEALRG